MSSAWWTFCSTSRIVRPWRFSSAIVSKIRSTMSGARPERRLVEQEQPRPAHQRPPDREHLLLAARQRPAGLAEPLLEQREQRRTPSRGRRRPPRRRVCATAPRRRFSLTDRRPKIRRPSGQCEMPSATIRSVGARGDVRALERDRALRSAGAAPRSCAASSSCPRRSSRSARRARPGRDRQRHALERPDVAVADVDVGRAQAWRACPR